MNQFINHPKERKKKQSKEAKGGFARNIYQNQPTKNGNNGGEVGCGGDFGISISCNIGGGQSPKLWGVAT